MNSFLFAVFAGVTSAVCFYAVAVLRLGFMFMMLPGLPVFYAGLTRGARTMGMAAIIAAALILFMSGLAGGIFFVLFSAAPAYIIVRRAVLCRKSSTQEREWFPLGLAFVELVALLALFVVATCFYYASQGGIGEALQRSIAENVQEMEPQVQELLLNLSSSLALIVIAASLWMWLLLAYINGWLAQKLAQTRGKALRPNFAITPFDMPRWMLGALTLSGLASLTGGATVAFAGKISLLLLLFPYFLMGMALIHARAASWPNKGILLFMIYFFLLAQAWPALLIAGFGVWHQLRNFNSTTLNPKP